MEYEPYLFKEMESDRLKLIKINPNHLRDIYTYASDKETVKFMSWPRHRNLKDTEKFIEMTCELYEEACHYDWAVWYKKDHKVIGTMGLHNRDRELDSVEIGYIIAKDYWGRGLVTEGAGRLIKFVFQDMNIKIVRATCHPENMGSERVMQKLGMTFKGLEPVRLIKAPESQLHRVYEIQRK
jgi:ribosomal-protein-alanine N-acetyltransferase